MDQVDQQPQPDDENQTKRSPARGNENPRETRDVSRPDVDVIYIGEDTPTPELPTRLRPRARPTGDDVLYIGDE